MNHFRSSGAFAALVMLAASGCERAKTPATDSAHLDSARTADSLLTAARGRSQWDSSAGPVLLVMADAPGRAYVLLPDTGAAALAAIPHPASVTLFGRGGSVQTAELPSVADSGACLSATLRAAPPPRPWNVGFIGGVVSPVALDSTESLTPADSAAFAATMTRLASAMPDDSAGRFAGLPFVVRSLWRFALPGGQEVVLGNLVRQINSEATPLQERTLVVSERPASDTTAATVYSERSYGAEETIESRDVLAALLLGDARNAAVVLVRDFGDTVSYSLLERDANGRWSVRWTSPRRHC